MAYSTRKSEFRPDRRGSIAMLLAMILPGMVMGIALGVEVTSWAAAQVSLQRSADFAAIAGAIDYKSTTNKQTAATVAARMAQLNGGSGTATPSWNPATATLADNLITAQIVTGVQNSTNTALKITVQKIIPATMSQAFSSIASHTVTATATAELITTTISPLGAAAVQPCLLALSSSGSITGSGSTVWGMPNCTVRSNGTVTVTGGGSPLNTAGIFAGGTISIQTGITVMGGQYPNDGTINDPYADNTALQSAFTTAAGLSGVSNIACGSVGGVVGSPGQYTGNNNCNGTNTLSNGGTCVTNSGVTCTLYPGNYGSFIISGGGPYTFNFQPGLYLFKGAISFASNSTSNGSAVTIVMAGTFTGSNTFNFNLSAPTPTNVASTGGVAGIVLAGNSSTTASISGATAFNVAGVVYFPNAIFDSSGSSCSSGTPCFGNSSTQCLEIIASSIKLSGYSYFNSSCTTYGTATFTSVAGTATTLARVVR